MILKILQTAVLQDYWVKEQDFKVEVLLIKVLVNHLNLNLSHLLAKDLQVVHLLVETMVVTLILIKLMQVGHYLKDPLIMVVQDRLLLVEEVADHQALIIHHLFKPIIHQKQLHLMIILVKK